MKQLEDAYVRFGALSFFFLCAKFCPFSYRHVKVTVNDKVGRFLGHDVYIYIYIYIYMKLTSQITENGANYVHKSNKGNKKLCPGSI